MKRATWYAMLILLFLHLFVVVGFGTWLYTSGRLNKERLAAVYDMFKPTIAEQEAEEQRLAKEIEAEKFKQEEAIRLKKAGDGPITLSDRMAERREVDEGTQLKLDRLERAKLDIQGQIARAQASLDEKAAKLAKDRAAFDEHIAERTEKLASDDFNQAVALLSAQKPKQAKAMLQTMLADGEQERVVDYLAAMQNRIAAKVLAEFKDPAEVAQATELVNALRMRGVYTMGPMGDNGA